MPQKQQQNASNCQNSSARPSKPAVPAKPSIIPPPPCGANKSHRASALTTPKPPEHGSPHIGCCANDCCGMLPSAKKDHAACSNKQNVGTATGDRVQGYDQNKRLLQQDSIDGSISSGSGGFRDPPECRASIRHTSQHYQQLEQALLAQKQDKDKRLKRGQQGATGSGRQAQTCADIMSQHVSTLQRQIQQKLQEEMKQQCKNIQEKHLIERRPPQQPFRPLPHSSDAVVTFYLSYSNKTQNVHEIYCKV